MGELFARAREFAILTIDIPIGLSDRDRRLCDVAARALLGRERGRSVFPAPVRAALAGQTWVEACALSERVAGKRLSKQTFAILPRIREVDGLLRSNRKLRRRVREVHPELCFYIWNGRRPMVHGKKTGEGRNERRALVEAYFGCGFNHIRRAIPSRLAADDDILDALAAVWTAERILSGVALRVSEHPPRDRFGLRMEMVA